MSKMPSLSINELAGNKARKIFENFFKGQTWVKIFLFTIIV